MIPRLQMPQEELQTTKARSALMSRIGQQDTHPEQAVRKLLWSLDGRYRVNVRDLPGTPDIANKTRQKVIFVHGCYWHHHEGCDRAGVPRRNSRFWREKFRRNKQRDSRKEMELEEMGFDILVVWECELREPKALRKRIQEFWFGKRD